MVGAIAFIWSLCGEVWPRQYPWIMDLGLGEGGDGDSGAITFILAQFPYSTHASADSLLGP
jgi:hypothetical protein